MNTKPTDVSFWKVKKMDRFKRVKISYREPKERVNDFREVCLGYTREEAIHEASRCLQCKNPKCVDLCPVGIDIPGFIRALAEGDEEKAADVLFKYTSLPAVCGRVCPQEDQCEKNCVMTKRGEAIAIGKLERYVGDYVIKFGYRPKIETVEKNGIRIAVVGSGPAGIACADELLDKGYDVTVFEALHAPGGVLVYGIPEFRLPKDDVVAAEISNLERKGAKIFTDTVIGRTKTVEGLLEEGYEAVFLGTGAGLPKFLNAEGENLNGVMSANEYLTRANLMRAHRKDSATPIFTGKHVVVVGGGNVAMDAARTAARMGAKVRVIYRREFTDLPAREEEIENAVQEGIKFTCLSQPLKFVGDDDGFVFATEIISMSKEIDGSVTFLTPIEGTEKIIRSDMVILALGTVANPLLVNTTEKLEETINGLIKADDDMKTSMEGVFAAGDAVSGAATVILAMGGGKRAARSINKMISEKKKNGEK